MNALSARRPVFSPVARFGWTGLAETTLRALLVMAAPVSAVIFVAHSL
ncbi:MAG: hypothetical protein H7236_03515 [Gemmatimonadaceae bacterium]|nr:hypothetical protein [Caulobacter sp.]